MNKVKFNKAKKSQKNKTITRTFRINWQWDKILMEEAEKQGISTSSLLNQILKKFSLYSRWTQRVNSINLSKHMLQKILGLVQIESLAEAGVKSGTLDPINIINTIGLANDYDSFVYLLTEYFGGPYFAMWFSCFHHKEENKDIFHLQHDLGYGWSVYLEKYFQSFLKSMFDMNVKTKIYEYALTLEVTHPKTKLQ